MNQQQQIFINEYLITGNATQAAIAAGYSEKTAQIQGSRLLKRDDIKQAIEQEQLQARGRTQITVDDLLTELETARIAALEQCQCGAAVSATMAKAKLLGLDKQLVDVTSNGESINDSKPTVIELIAPKFL